RGGKLAPRACWGLHLGVLQESKGWEVLHLTDNKVVMSVEVIFYETLSLEVWKVKYGPASGRTQPHPPTDTSMAMVPLRDEVNEPADEDVVEVLSPPPILAPPTPVADRLGSTPVLATSDEGSLEALPVALAREPVEQEATAVVQSIGEQQTGWSIGELSKSARGEQPVEGSTQPVEERELSEGEESTNSDVVEFPVEKPDLRRTGRTRKPPKRLVFHTCLPPATFTMVHDKADDDLLYDDAEDDVDLPELDPYVHADPEHRWDIATMTNRWVLTAKYRIDDTVEREKARLVVKGFTQVYGADYDETYSPVSSYVMLRIFFSIVAVLDLKRASSTGCSTCTRQTTSTMGPARALKGVLLGADWKKSQVDTALYFKAGDDEMTCWVLVYVDDLLAASSSTTMLKELPEAAFELREILPVVKYLGLEIVGVRPARKLWLH
ncbi:unnamed protein product, partial [Closterium sp. NIES-54]